MVFINIHSHHRDENETSKTILNYDNESISMESCCFSYGIHPMNSNSQQFDQQILQKKSCIAIGEIGVDKTLNIPIGFQIKLFKDQIQIAEKFKLPVILHCVKAWNEIVKIKNEFSPKQYWIYHGFRKINLVDSVIESGTFISIGSAVMKDFKLQEAVKKIPLDQLFIETDTDLNYTIKDIYTQIAMLKNISLQELTENIYLNSKKVFKKWEIG